MTHLLADINTSGNGLITILVVLLIICAIIWIVRRG